MDTITADSWVLDPDTNLRTLQENWEKIPELGVISSNSLRDNQLVRFRGMIQDMDNPVMYLSQFEVLNLKTGVKEKRNGKYKDVLIFEEEEVILHDSVLCQNDDRRAYYCISIPGMNNWASPPKCDYNSTEREENSFYENKRSADQMEIEEASDDSSNIINKRPCTSLGDEGCTSNCGTSSNLPRLNFPVDGQNNYSCFVNVYDKDDESIKMNEIFDFVGFISFTRACDNFDDMPPSLVPRLHAVTFRKILHSNPLFSSVPDHSDVFLRAEKLRSDIMLPLTQLLFGDTLAAEYLLCNLISRIHTRQDALTLGKFAVNISGMPVENGYTEEFYKVITHLVPKSHYIPMSLEVMNGGLFLPQKDYECNRLNTGKLQLSNQTHLVLDETKLQAGKLIENGILNVRALENLILFQKLDFDFKYHTLEFQVDIPVIVLSEGKSILTNDFHVILKPDLSCMSSFKDTFMAINEYLKEPLLSDIRLYLTVVSQSSFDLPDDLVQTIEEDFVKLRQLSENKITQFDLHNLLVFARLLSLSYGKTVLSKDLWDKAFSLEIERKDRIILNSQRD